MPTKLYLTIALVMFILTASLTFPSGFNGIYSVNSSQIWVVGNSGAIYRSNDAGNSFLDRSAGTQNYNAVTGISPHIWVGGDNGAFTYSTNAGVSFTVSNIGTTDNIKSLAFANTTTGWAVCISGKIFMTNDSGLNWIQQAWPSTNSLNSMKFSNATTGVICGDNSALFTTTNGGTNWVQRTLPVSKKLFQVDFKGNVILVSAADGLVFKSVNFGSSWSVIDYNVTTKPDVAGLFMLDSNRFYSCGVGGFIRKSTNAGLTFTYQNNPALLDLGQVCMYDSTIGWILSTGSNIVLRTTNSGANWLLPAGVTQTLSWSLKLPLIYYTSSGNVFYQSLWNKNEIFVTKSNVVYRSLNLGDSWVQVGTPMPYGLISNSFFVSSGDTNIFLVAIDSSDNLHGKVLRSTNYGQTWQVSFGICNRSSDGIPLVMDPNHTDTMYYAPTDSNLFRSTNFGLTWAQVGSRRFDGECTIRVKEGNSNIIMIGTSGSPPNYLSHLTRSTDFGLTWTAVDSNAGSSELYPELPSIASTTLDSVLYCTQYQGFTGGVKRTLNNGAFWSYVNLDQFAWGLDVARDDPNVFVYAVWQYTGTNAGYITYDRGSHFTPLPYLSNANNFAVYFYNRNNLLMQQSMGIYKLRADITSPIGIQPVSTEIPKGYLLEQNYPNPFNPSTTIRFDIPAGNKGNKSVTRLVIYDALGRELEVLVNDLLTPGKYELKWDASKYAGGVYFYRLASGEYTETRKMILVK